MVNTTSAGLSEGQATGSMVRAESGTHDDGSQPYVPETPLEGGQPQQTNDRPESAAQNDASQDGHDDIPNGSGSDDQLAVDGPLTAQEEQDKQSLFNAEIAQLRAQKAKANSKRELARLRKEAARGFEHDKDIGSESFKPQLTIERAKSVR